MVAGCQERMADVEVAPKITRTVTVGGLWNDETKTIINENGDLVFAGTEDMAVGYANGDAESKSSGKSIVSGIVKATSQNKDGNYTFEHDAIAGAGSYDYFFIMPYRGVANISTNSGKTSMFVKLDSIQTPTLNSFDPLQDYMIARPIFGADTKREGIAKEELKFKRIIAATKLVITDSENALKGEPVQSVTVKFPLTDNKDKKNNLISLIYLNQVEDYAAAGASGYADVPPTTKHVSPSVKLKYDNGLLCINNEYTAWMATLPVEKAAGTELTVIVETAETKVVRKVTLTKSMTFTADKINTFRFNISGEGAIIVDKVDPNDYWSLYEAGMDIQAGNLVINKENYPNAKLVKLSAAADGEALRTQYLQKGGVIFFDSEDGEATFTNHLKPIKNTVMIGRYKDAPAKIVMSGGTGIYFSGGSNTDGGDTVYKNLDITSGTNTQLFIVSADLKEDCDYLVIEDCKIDAQKNVFSFTDAALTHVIKNVTFNNCVVKMSGTDANYSFAKINKGTSAQPAQEGYGKLENITINNCVVYAEKLYQATGTVVRRQVMDLGNNANNYTFPTSNLNVTVTNNTFYNINANGNILVRAYVLNSATITGNVFYNDLTSLTTPSDFKSSYIFGLYAALEGEHDYKVRNCCGYDYRPAEVTTDAWKWKYASAGPQETYKVGDNNIVKNSETKDACFSTVNLTVGKFVANENAKDGKGNIVGANYDTKYWIK